VGGETPAGRAFEQGRFQASAGLWPQARLAARAPRAFQTRAPMPAPSPIPTVRGGATHFETPNNFGLGMALGKQLGSLQAAGLQGREVPPRPKRRIHAPRLSQ
jgi:hypothetical protein